MEYIFPSPHFQFVYTLRSEVNLLQAAYIWVLFVYLATRCLLIGTFNPPTFKVIIDMYVLIAIFSLFSDCFYSSCLSLFHSFALPLKLYLDSFLFLCVYLLQSFGLWLP